MRNNNTKNEINLERHHKGGMGGRNTGKYIVDTILPDGVKRELRVSNTPLDYRQRIEGVDYNVKKEWHPLMKASLKFLSDEQYKTNKLTLSCISSTLFALEDDGYKLKGLKKGFEFFSISKVLNLAPASKKENLIKKYNSLYEKIKGGKTLDLTYNITVIGQNKKLEYTNLDVYQVTNYLLKKCRLIKGRPTLEVLKYQKVGRYEIPAELSYKNDRIILSIKTSL